MTSHKRDVLAPINLHRKMNRKFVLSELLNYISLVNINIEHYPFVASLTRKIVLNVQNKLSIHWN